MKNIKNNVKLIFPYLSLGLLSCNNVVINENESLSLIGNDSVLSLKSNGKIKEMYQIKNGTRKGFYKLFNDAEQIIEEGSIIDNNKEGLIKTYQNNSLKAVTYYEKNKKVYELDKNDFIYDSLDLKLFKIMFPISWEKSIRPQENVLLIGHKKCDSTDMFCPSFSITNESLKTSLIDYSSNALLLMQSKVEKMKIINKNNFTINGFDVVQVRYMILKDGVTLGLQTGFFKIDDVVYILTGTALNSNEGNFLKYDGLFEEIILSLHK